MIFLHTVLAREVASVVYSMNNVAPILVAACRCATFGQILKASTMISTSTPTSAFASFNTAFVLLKFIRSPYR